MLYFIFLGMAKFYSEECRTCIYWAHQWRKVINFKAFEQVVILHLFHWVTILPHQLFQKDCEKAILVMIFFVCLDTLYSKYLMWKCVNSENFVYWQKEIKLLWTVYRFGFIWESNHHFPEQQACFTQTIREPNL